MPHYLFSYDVDADAEPKTQKTKIDEAICDLIKNEGFKIYKLDISTAYRIYHPDNKFKFIEKHFNGILNKTDRRLVLKIETYIDKEDNKKRPFMSEKGELIKCD